jgi:hypothetical protein
MAGLPFIVKPKLQPIMERLGDEETGIIEIERRGFLSVSEKAFLQQISGGDETATAVLRVTKKVATQEKLSSEKAYKLFSEVLTGAGDTAKHRDIADKYADDIEQITLTLLHAESNKEFLRASCMLMYRVDANLDPSAVNSLHPDLIKALSDLCLDEERRSTAKLESLSAGLNVVAKESDTATATFDLEKK